MTCKINADTSNGLKLESDTSGAIDLQTNGTTKVQMDSSGNVIVAAGSNFCIGATNDVVIGRATDDRMTFNTGGTERGRFDESGNFFVSTVDSTPWNNNNSDPGCVINAVSGGEGLIVAARTGGDPMALNRMASDGNVFAFYKDGALKGTISVSGDTVSYNAFTGSHWSRLSDNSKPTILKGTVLETIDAMCDWYELEFTNAAGTPKIEEIVLPEGKSVGDSYTITYYGESVTGTIRKKSDDKHTMCKVSNTEDSARVYGVYKAWNEETPYNDMFVNSVGTSVVRVASGVTVSAGDLLSSKGDGTAKLQGDDIIKTKTIGKVLSNVKQETYDDGSFTVPCALYCG